MEAKECSVWENCSANICPADEINMDCACWYPNEEYCTAHKFSKLLWVKNQRKIARKARNKDLYFTKEMLDRNFIITAATEGLDPDKTDYQDDRAVKNWLRKHPEKKEKTETEKEILRNRLLKYRKGIIPITKDQSAEENLNFDGISLGEL